MSNSGAGRETGVIQSVSREGRLFPPPPEFAARARLNDAAAYQKLYRRSIDDPDGFWDGERNLSANCLDRHLVSRGDKPAIVWEGEPGEQKVLTFRQLHAEVCR